MNIILTITFISMLIFLIYSIVEDHRKLKEKQNLYSASKFPITSKMGNQYYSEIKYEEHDFLGYIFYCNIYKRIIKNNGKHKDKLIYSEQVDFESFDYNYIKVVSQCIDQYEKDNMAELENKKYKEYKLNKNKKEFNNWDGIIK